MADENSQSILEAFCLQFIVRSSVSSLTSVMLTFSGITSKLAFRLFVSFWSESWAIIRYLPKNSGM
jgi:hypothetical protein